MIKHLTKVPVRQDALGAFQPTIGGRKVLGSSLFTIVF